MFKQIVGRRYARQTVPTQLRILGHVMRMFEQMIHQLYIIFENRFAKRTFHIQRYLWRFGIVINSTVIIILQWYHLLGHVRRNRFRRPVHFDRQLLGVFRCR